MKTFRKIAAFTLAELLIVLAISSVVAGLAMTIITIFGRNIQLIQNNYDRNTQQNLFEEQLTMDFNRFNSIDYNFTDHNLILKTPLDSINYIFTGDFIIRELDTILRAENNVRLFYRGNEIKRGPVDGLKFEFNNKAQDFVFIYKENDAHNLMLNGN